MNRFPKLLALLILLILVPNCAWSSAQTTKGQPYAPGELLLKYNPGVPPERIGQIEKSFGLTLLKIISTDRIYHYQLEKRALVEDIAQRLSELPEVSFAEPNYIFRIDR